MFLFKPEENFAIIRAIKTQPNVNEEFVINFITEFYISLSDDYPEMDSLIVYPGTYNPLIVKAHLQVINNLSLTKKILYNDNEVIDENKFLNEELFKYVDQVDTFVCGKPLCDFKKCSIISSLPNRNVANLTTHI